MPKNTYQITLTYQANAAPVDQMNGQVFDVPYRQSGAFLDRVQLSPDKIVLTARRERVYTLRQAIANTNNTIGIQLRKAMAIHGLLFPALIIGATLKRHRTKSVLAEEEIESAQLRQPFPALPQPIPDMDVTALTELLPETEKGRTMLAVATHMLRASAEQDANAQFEHYWKAFNRLYAHIGGPELRAEAQRHIRSRALILENVNCFPLSVQAVSQFTTEELRKCFRWRGFVRKNYGTPKQAQSFTDFITRYSDFRIMRLIVALTPLQMEHLDAAVNTPLVSEHLQHHIRGETRQDGELLVLLAIKYAYFVRNGSMHGERINAAFSILPNHDEEELSWLSMLLRTLLTELLNAHRLY